MKNIIVNFFILIFFAMAFGCGKKASVSIPSSSNKSDSINQTETKLPADKTDTGKIETSKPRKLKALKMGQAINFSLLAYSNINSNSHSSISGKVGLLPGNREQIKMDTDEVAGGASNIYGGDDDTMPINFLSNAKVDMVLAYKEALSFQPDKDKVGLVVGVLSSKILAPGCYMWNGNVTISNDFTLEGSDTDIWIFRVAENLKVASKVRLTLSGGAKAKNVFWQVAGATVLGEESVFSGTIISQQSIELQNRSNLTGRAFAKNGFINLNQATINLP